MWKTSSFKSTKNWKILGKVGQFLINFKLTFWKYIVKYNYEHKITSKRYRTQQIYLGKNMQIQLNIKNLQNNTGLIYAFSLVIVEVKYEIIYENIQQ